MKKLFSTILLFSFLWCSISFGEIKFLEENQQPIGKTLMSIKIVCIDNYKFIITSRVAKGTRAVSTVQMFEERNGKSLPAKC